MEQQLEALISPANNIGRLSPVQPKPDCADSSGIESRAKPFINFLQFIDSGDLRGHYYFRGIRKVAGVEETVQRICPFGSPAQVTQAFAELDRLNQDGYNIFVVVNEGSGFLDADITNCHCVFADWDAKATATTEEKLGQVTAFKPAAIVHTSQGKFHAYWRITGIPISRFKAIQQAIGMG